MLRGEWLASESSLKTKKPILHFVAGSDKESYCTGVSKLTYSEIGRHCYRCLIYLIRDGYMKAVWA